MALLCKMKLVGQSEETITMVGSLAYHALYTLIRRKRPAVMVAVYLNELLLCPSVSLCSFQVN